MSDSLYSPSWYRVADLKPRLRSHARIHRQVFRGQVWYVLQDRASGHYHRFSPSAHLVISLMDGSRTVQEIWDQSCAKLDEDILTQDEIIRLLSQLHRSDILQGDVPPDIIEMTERADKQRKRKLIFSVLNPLAVRLPLIDPERFISATYPLVKPLFGWVGSFLFLGLVGTAVVMAGLHWSELTENISDRVLAADSIVLLLITYPFVKSLHELGHAYAVKHWGGEVHEMGVMFLVLMPVPYVDASASAAYREKWRRAAVGAAGIIVEIFLASIALFVWLNVEPGMVRAFAFNVMLIGGISTLLFNGNPLLKFDGYYVFSDLLEIPNLFQRANRYILYLIQRYLFGLRSAVSPASAPGESGWFLFYGLGSFAYRMFIMVAIILFVATKFFFVGVLLATWSCLMMYGLPLAKGFWYLVANPALRRKRGRAFLVSGLVGGAAAVALLAIPVPYATVTDGVIWVPGDAAIYANTEGMVADVLAQPNSIVSAGAALIRMEDPFLAARVRILTAEVNELGLRYQAVVAEDRAEANIAREQLRHAQADLALNRQRAKDLVVRSPRAGEVVLPYAADLPGRFLRKGELVAYIADFSAPVIRVVVGQDVVDLVRQRTRGVSVRLSNPRSVVLPAEIMREVPSASDQLPSLALSTVGGGELAIDPTDSTGTRVLEHAFQFELRVPPSAHVSSIGGRIYVRFDHGSEALAWRALRSIRQLFLKQFNV